MSPVGDSQWETKHSPFVMQASIQITFQLETRSPILVFHFKIVLRVLGILFPLFSLQFKRHINSVRGQYEAMFPRLEEVQ